MAKIHYSPGIELTTGALDSGKHELITRQKHLHNPDGSLSKTCAVEAYLQKRKRNYTQTPPRGAELAHLQNFGEAARRTTALMRAYKSPDSASVEQRALLEQYLCRFQAQFNGTPDPLAPLDKLGKPRRYYRFDNFIRAMIYQELKNT